MATTLNLSDTQLILITTASQRDAGNLLPLPASLTRDGPRIDKAIECLIKLELACEAPTTVATQAWRQDNEARIGLVITDAGRIAIGVDPLVPGNDSDAADSIEAPLNAGSVIAEMPEQNPASFRTGSKQALVVKMLSTEAGASLDALVAATGWLPHTTRAAITGLRKRGHAVLTEKRDGACSYRITALA